MTSKCFTVSLSHRNVSVRDAETDWCHRGYNLVLHVNTLRYSIRLSA
jgi:hypothetical protein